MDAAKDGDEDAGSYTTNRPATIFSQFRNFSNNLGVNSFGSLFNSTAASSSAPYPSHYPDFDSQSGRALHSSSNQLNSEGGIMEEGVTPTPTRPPSPRRFASVKNIFSGFASRSSRNLQSLQLPAAQTHHHAEAAQDEIDIDTPKREMPLTPLLDHEFAVSDYFLESLESEPSGPWSPHEYQQLSASGSYGSSELDDTPPLTPESLITDINLLSPASHNLDLGYDYLYDFDGPPVEGAVQEDVYMDFQDENEPSAYTRPKSMEIKEGKKPERPVNYDALLADISNDADADALLASGDSDVDGALIPEDDKDEWYGLEYTLELSTRERRASETPSVGEHSKSRESWAAIHQGTVHPFFEDEEYYQWKNWHRYLDRQDEKRKHRRGIAFKAHAKELAWLYVDQMHARDLMYWQKELYDDVDKEILERLRLLDAHRPDPYYPPRKHLLAWYLKRSRSVASLRELRRLPEV